MGKKTCIRIISFDEIEQNGTLITKQNPYSGQITSLHLEFEKLCTESKSAACNVPAEESLCKDANLGKLITQEFRFKKISDSLNEKIKQANQLIHRMESCQLNWSDQEGYQEDLLREFRLANSELSILNKDRRELHQCLLQRRDCLLQQNGDSTPASARKNFRSALELFLLNFFQIALDDKENPHRQFLVNELTNFIKAFTNDFAQQGLVSDTSKIKELRLALFQKIGQTPFSLTDRLTKLSSLFKSKGSSDNNLAEQLDLWLAGFFDSITSSVDPFEQKKQIISFYHLQAHLGELDIKLVKDYATLALIEAQKKREIVENYFLLQSDLEKLHKNLQSKLALFIETTVAAKQIAWGKELQADLERDLEQLSLMDTATKQYNNFSVDSPLDRIPINRIKSIIQNQEDMLTKLKNYQAKLPQISAAIHQLLSDLENKYTQEKNRLLTRLAQSGEALKKNEEALQYVKKDYLYSHDRSMVEEKLQQTQQCLVIQANKHKKLVNKTKLPLGTLNAEILTADETTTKQTNTVRECLQTICRRPRVQINSAIRQFFDSLYLNERNVYKRELNNLDSLTANSSAALNQRYQQLEEVPATEMIVCLENFTREAHVTQQYIRDRQDISSKAIEIERRLGNLIYKESNTIVQELSKEFERILNEVINKAPKLSDAEKELIERRFIPYPVFPRENEKNLLNRLDPRLTKLLEIITHFTALNSRYINKDITILRDDASYDKKFFDLISNHLCNDHMEDISDGDLSELIQFIRRLFLKPLINFLHTHSYLKPLKNFLELTILNSIVIQDTKRISSLTFFASKLETKLWNCAKQAFIVGENKGLGDAVYPQFISSH